MKTKLVLISFLILLLSTAFVGVFAHQQFKRCTSDYLKLLQPKCQQFINTSTPLIQALNKVAKSDTLTKLTDLITQSQELLPYQDYLLGQNTPTTYLILLQNDFELRANGGFTGSYAVITANHAKFDLRFVDIYTPDGQITGHIDPPPPIQEAFQTGEFRLRDFDWSPDFPKAAAALRWFLKEASEVNPDIVITLNQTLIKDLLAQTGPIQVPEYQTTLDQDNVYLFLQGKSEIGFFPGSTQKKDAITAVGQSFLRKVASLPPQTQLQVINTLLEQLNRQNIVINSQQDNFQKFIREKNWAGELQPANCGNSCLADSFSLIEVNLGANKANCCTARQTTHQVSQLPTAIQHTITLDLHNSSAAENPTPPLFYGGNYISYLRFYIPTSAQNIAITANSTIPTTLTRYPQPYTNSSHYDQAYAYGFQEIGFFHITKSSSSSQASLTYTLPIGDYQQYQLTIFKQNGLKNSPQIINLFSSQQTTNLETDYSSSTIPIR